MRSRLLAALILAMVPAACGDCCDDVYVAPESPRRVSILVEVYDPVTNSVWENVSVRIVEAYNEWSGCTCISPWYDWYLTDSGGRVLFDEFAIADAEVGFYVDGYGAAVLGPGRYEDEAYVLLEIDAVGFAPVYVEVALRWGEPDVFVEVPFF